jgi:hypothetical protein
MPPVRSSKLAVALISLCAVAAVVLLVLLLALRRNRPADAEHDPEAGSAGARRGGRGPAGLEPSRSAGASQAAAAGAGAPAQPRRIGPDERARLLAALQRRWGAGVASGGGASGGAGVSAGSAEKPGSLDKDYIRERIREVVPLVKECYHQALKRGPTDAGSNDGVLKVSFSIIGDPELGGVIEDSQVTEDSSLAANASLAECVQESMYALQLKAPKGGGRVKVTYPFRFSSRPDEAPAR